MPNLKLKGNENVEIGWFRVLGVKQGHQHGHQSIECIWLPIWL